MKIAMTWLLMTYCYTHRSVHPCVLMRESSCSRHTKAVDMQRKRSFGALSPKWHIGVTLLSLGLRDLCRREEGKALRWWSSRHNRNDAHRNTQTLWHQAQDLHTFKPDKFPDGEGDVGTKSHPQSRSYLQLIVLFCIVLFVCMCLWEVSLSWFYLFKEII